MYKVTVPLFWWESRAESWIWCVVIIQNAHSLHHPTALQATKHCCQCVYPLTGTQPESLFAPKSVDSCKFCGDKCVLPKKNITCPHDEHHYNDDEFSSPQLGSLTNLLHRHLFWRENAHTHRHRVNKASPRTLRFIVPESKSEIAITLKLCRER